jgi:hypothetical protein
MWGRRSNLKQLLIFACAAIFVALGALGIWRATRGHSLTSSPASSAGTIAVGQTHAAGTQQPPATSAGAHRNYDRRAAASPPLPPSGTPLAQIYDELKARADAGDAPAASRLYREVTSCVTARLGLSSVRSSLKGALGEDFSKLSADRISRKEKAIASLQQQLARYETADSLCGDLSAEQLQMIPVSLQAALLGDPAAAACFVHGPLFFTNGLLDHPEWITQYKQNALALANIAVEHGDWEMVPLMQFAYLPPIHTEANLFAQVTGSDPAMAYRYAKVGQLGSAGSDTPAMVQINSSTIAVLGAGHPEFETLSAETIAAGDAWAEDAFRRFFGGVPRKSPTAMQEEFCRAEID